MSGYGFFKSQNKRPLAMALEQRFMFDAAGAATASEVAEQAAMDAEGNQAVANGAPSAQSSEKSIYFIDSQVGDYQNLIAGLSDGAQYYVLDMASNGLDQMADILSGQSGVDAVHVISHGSQGVVYLGDSALSLDNIEQNRDALEIIGNAMSADGDILLYGCRVGANAEGSAFLEALAQVTSADISASDDVTGASGDWLLEKSTGTIEAEIGISQSALKEYTFDLSTFDFTGATDNGATVTQTDGTVTLTISNGSGDVSISNTGEYFGESGASIWTESTSASVTFSFSQAVNVTSIFIGAGNAGPRTYTFTPTGGSGNSAVVDNGIPAVITAVGTGKTVNLNWTGITSFTITDSASQVNISADTLIYTVAPSDPTITSATYDASSGALVVTGSNFTATGGATNDVIASKITLTGEGGATYTLTDTANVEITSATEFTLSLSATDKAALNQIFNKNGATSTGATTYDVDGAAGFIAAKGTVADTDVNGVTVSSVSAPTLDSATYNYATNVLTVTGTNFVKSSGATNDVDLSKLTLTGEGGATYTLTTATDVEITNGTTFSLTLSGADIVGVESLLNKDGTTAASGTTFNLAGAAGFMRGDSTTAADASASVTVSNYAVPTVTSATFNYATGVLVVTGTNFVSKSGASNDVDISKLAFTGEGGAQYQLTSASDVEVTSATSYSVTLSGADLAAVRGLLNKDGTTSAVASTTFSLASAEDWMAGSPAANNVADAAATITVSNYAAPTITSATYDYSTNQLVVTGANFASKSGGANDIDISLLTFTGEGGTTYTLSSASDVELDSPTQFTITLSGADLVNVETILNKNGTTSATSGTTYNLAAADNWLQIAPAATDIADATGNGITVSNYANPAVTSATYDWSTGVVTLTGTNFVAASGANNDITANLLTFTGEGGATYTLSDTSNVDITSATAATLTLSATDKLAVNGLLNGNGTTSATAGTTYNIAFADNWAAGAPAANNIADATAGVTVSNYAAPTITSATYDYNTNTLVVTGTNFVGKTGATNDVDISLLTLTGEGGATYTLTSATDVEVTSATSFSITLSGADITGVESLLNKDGTTATSGTTYNLAAADNWLAAAPSGRDIADTTGNGVTVSNYTAPAITSSTYDWSTGVLTLTGTNFVSASGATNDIDVTKLTITGEGGATYTLTSSNVEITSATAASITLNAADKLAVHGLLNKNGTASDGTTTYNVAAADNWMTGSPAATDIADATTGVTVSNVATPTVTSATYDSDTGILVVTGTNFVSKSGAANDIDVSTITLTGGTGSATYTLTTATDVEVTSATSFTVTLTGADKTNVDALLDQIGTSSSGGSTYNIGVADNWMTGAAATTDIADAAGNAVTVSIAPKITSSTYNASTGVLVVTGTNIQANGGGADIDASMFTFTGEGGETYTLTDTTDVERDSTTQFTLTLSATDKAAVNLMLNKNGTSSTGGTTYNLAAADNWDTNVTAGDTSDATGNGITVSAVAVPTITSATYNMATDQLVVTGTNFLKRSGAANDIDISTLTVTGEGGATYTLTSASDVEITSGTSFTITLSTADAAGVEAIMSANGTNAAGGQAYNLGAAEDWAAGADSAVNVVDATGNAITVSGYNPPAITGVAYDFATGVLTLTGTNFVSKTGAANDIDASLLTITGEGGATYTLTDTSDVEITSATSASLTLSTTDRLAVNGLLNKDGTTSATAGTTYNMAAAEDWMTGTAAAVNVVDATTALTVSNYAGPTITSATYDVSSNQLVVTGTNFVSKSGAANDIDISTLTLTGKASGTYTLQSATDVEVTSATQFTITLDATDAAGVEALLDANGTSSTDTITYNLAVADNWLAQAPSGADISDAAGNGVTVSGISTGTTTTTTTTLNVSQIGDGSSDPAGDSGSDSGAGNEPALGGSDSGLGGDLSPVGAIGAANFGAGGIDSTSWGDMLASGSASSSSVITDPSSGVDGMSIVRNAVTGNDGALNSFYGASTRIGSSSGGDSAGRGSAGGTGGLRSFSNGLAGLSGGATGGLSGLANSLGGGLGSGGFGGGLGGGIGASDGGGLGNGLGGAPAPGDGGLEQNPAQPAAGGEQAMLESDIGRLTFSAQLAQVDQGADMKIVKSLAKAS